MQYTTLKPLGDRVLVKIKTVEERTDGGILLPSTALNKPNAGEVVAVGEGKTFGKTKLDISVSVLRQFCIMLMLSSVYVSLRYCSYSMFCMCRLGLR